MRGVVGAPVWCGVMNMTPTLRRDRRGTQGFMAAMVRLLWLGLLSILGAFSLSGCGSSKSETLSTDPDDWRSQIDVIRAGVKGSEEDPAVLRRWDALQRYLEDATGLPVKFYEASDYNGIIQAMASGQIHLASMGAGSFANIYSQIGDRAVPIFTSRDTHGNRGYYSTIVVRSNSEFESIEDLEGKSLAFVDFNSTSGYIYPRWKMREEGIDPDTFFGEIALAGGHSQAMMALANGQFDATVLAANGGSPEQGFTSGSLRKMARRGLIDARDYREIWYGGAIANSPYVMRADVPQALRDLIAGAMISLAFEDPETFGDIGRTPGSYFSPVDVDFYQEIIEMREMEILQHRQRFAGRVG